LNFKVKGQGYVGFSVFLCAWYCSYRGQYLALSTAWPSYYTCLCLLLLISGATRELGSALTRLCIRHRSVESKLKTFARLDVKQNNVKTVRSHCAR